MSWVPFLTYGYAFISVHSDTSNFPKGMKTKNRTLVTAQIIGVIWPYLKMFFNSFHMVKLPRIGRRILHVDFID